MNNILFSESIENAVFYTTINIAGTSYDPPAKVDLSWLITDYTYHLTDLEFVEKYYPEILGKDFNKEELDQEELDDLIEYIDMTMTYSFNFKDGGGLIVHGSWIDDDPNLYPEIIDDSPQAREFLDLLGSNEWNTCTLDELVEFFREEA